MAVVMAMTVLTAHPVEATTYYTWYRAVLANEPGCSNNACVSADATCQSSIGPGFPPSYPYAVYPEPNPGTAVCVNLVNRDFGPINVDCTDNGPPGSVPDSNTPMGCAPANGPSYGKDIGASGCPCNSMDASKTLGPKAPGNPSGGEPISIATGNVFYQTTDYETAGQNKLSFKR